MRRTSWIALLLWLMAGLAACGEQTQPAADAGPGAAATVAPGGKTGSAAAPAASAAPAPADAAAAPRDGAAQVVYLRYNYEQQRGEIWSIDLNGQHDRMLTACPAPCSVDGPAASPDGQQIVYVVSPEGGDTAAAGLHLMRADGSDDRVLDPEAAMVSGQAFSPDGSRLAYVRFRVAGETPVPQASLWVVDTAGGAAQEVLPAGFFRSAPVWAGNERLIYSQGTGSTLPEELKLYSVELDGAAPRELGPGPLLGVSPAGDAAVVLVKQGLRGADAAPSYNLGLVPLNGDEPRLLTQGGETWQVAEWSPDGSRIAFLDQRSRTLQALNPIDGSREELVPLEGEPTGWLGIDLAWTPDGLGLVYTLGRAGTTELRLLDIPSGTSQTLTTYPGDPGPLVVIGR